MPHANATSRDSRPDTHEHIHRVRQLLTIALHELLERATEHDRSKLHEPERSAFDQAGNLKHVTYGSDDYHRNLSRLRGAIDHHQQHNRHHPEYHPAGVAGMTLIDLIEMACDWIAASERHDDGDPIESVEINARRFGYDDEVRAILLNTIHELRARDGSPT